MAKLPIGQVNDLLKTGKIFAAEAERKEGQFWPEWADEGKTVLAANVDMPARVPNPLNANRNLTICNSIHSRGVYGAVRTLADPASRDANEWRISTTFGDARSFAILMSAVIRTKVMTLDFNSPDVVLNKWAEGRRMISLGRDPGNGRSY